MRNLYLIILLCFIAISCKDYHNEMIEWSNSIPVGTPIDQVNEQQPDYLKIDWDHPKTDDSTSSYFIKEIKGNRDILNMSYDLIFVNDNYQGRIAKK